MNKNKPLFITIEGGEGSGKTTQSILLKEYLEKKGFKVLRTREPGGTVLAESIRQILLNPDSNLTPLSELLLYEAARSQHISEIVLPALKKGKFVICDRFTDATIAYQGYGRKLDLQLINKLNTTASLELKPVLTIYLDIEPNVGLDKAKNLDKESYGKSGDRIERESLRFHKDVRKGYLSQAKKYPKRIKIIKTNPDVNKTWDLIKKEIDKKISRHSRNS
ncbi:MAG: dTMP kinase [Endomicrobia bacterium]|nr:dTMP kinase [Endomicrobiia bacterium]MCL2799389.1 dTMP kinase [Endomicrobiia bacterium]